MAPERPNDCAESAQNPPTPTRPEPLVFRTQHGDRVHMRDVAPRDALLLADLFYRLSERSRRLRYFCGGPPSLTRAWQEATRVALRQADERAALIATIQRGGAEEAIALAEMARDQRMTTIGELAIVVRDDYQRHGVGSALLSQLALTAQEMGITSVRAEILFENRAAQRLIRRLFGSPIATQYTDVIEMLAQLPATIGSC